MTDYRLDDVDAQLLNLLQENARYPAIELAERIGVSDNTIHNRMDRLEATDVVRGYTATVDNDRLGFGLHFQFSCTCRISDRADVARAAMEIPQVVGVTELMTGQANLDVRVVGVTDEQITRVAEQLDELDLEIEDENLVRTEHSRALDYRTLSELLEDGD